MSKVTVTNLGDVRKLSESNRFQFPAVLEMCCPECGACHTKNFMGNDYLSYPTVNAPFEIVVWCPNCDAETPVKLKLTITLALVER